MSWVRKKPSARWRHSAIASGCRSCTSIRILAGMRSNGLSFSLAAAPVTAAAAIRLCCACIPPSTSRWAERSAQASPHWWRDAHPCSSSCLSILQRQAAAWSSAGPPPAGSDPGSATSHEAAASADSEARPTAKAWYVAARMGCRRGSSSAARRKNCLRCGRRRRAACCLTTR